MQWKTEPCPYLKTVVRQVQNAEQTLEVRLSEGMPDIGRVVCAWGQCILRGKQTHAEEMNVSGGISAWVVYLSEEQEQINVLEAWIPFQLRWSLPQTKANDIIRAQGRLKGLDARMLSARKILLRADIAVLAEALEPSQAQIYAPAEQIPDVEMLTRTYPAVLARESGEKSFRFEEDINVPEAKTWLAWSLEPQITEQSLLGNRIVLRGTGHLRGIYVDGNGTLGTKAVQIPFSQFIDLEKEYDKQAGVEIMAAVSGLDSETTQEGTRIVCTLAVQYVVREAVLLQITQDAYSPVRDVEVTTQTLQLPMELDRRTEQVTAQSDFADGKVIDRRFLCEFPTQFRETDTLHIELKGNFLTLYEDAEGALRSTTQPWTQELHFPAAPNTRTALSVASVEPQGESAAISLTLETDANEQIPMVTGLELGAIRPTDDARPALILKRMDECTLWELAKQSGSTVAAIREANGLTDEAESGQMLLIPIL